jgi:hypothetical protein
MNEDFAFLNPLMSMFAPTIAHAGPSAVPPPEPKSSRNALYGYAQDEWKFSSQAAGHFIDNVGLETDNAFVPVKEKGNRQYEGGKTKSGRGLIQITGTQTRKLLNDERNLQNNFLQKQFAERKITKEQLDSRLINYDFSNSDFTSVEENLAAIQLFLRGKAREKKMATIAEDGSYNVGIWNDAANWKRAMNPGESDRDERIAAKKTLILSQVLGANKPVKVKQNGKDVFVPTWRVDTDKFKEDLKHYREHKPKK